MNFKSKLRVTKPLATIISIVCIALLGFIFQGCEKEDIYYEEEIVYSSEENGFHLYNNSVFPSSIRSKLTDSDFELLCNLSEEYGVYFLDPGEYNLTEFKKINSYDELQKIMNVSLTYAEPTIETDRRLNRLDIKTPRLKSGNVEEYVSGTASIQVATITSGFGLVHGYINLNWAYHYNNTLHIALNVSDVNVSISGGGYGWFCTFSGTKAVNLNPKGIEFSYVVNGRVWIGASIGGMPIGIPTALDINKSGNYLCPY